MQKLKLKPNSLYVVLSLCLLLLIVACASRRMLDVEVTNLVYKVYLPYTWDMRLDCRFGLTEHAPAERGKLAMNNPCRYMSQQWKAQNDSNTAFFIRPAHRPVVVYPENAKFSYALAGKPNLFTGEAQSPATEFTDAGALVAFAQAHPGRLYIVGNELSQINPIGDDVTPAQYAQWYHDSWALIKAADQAAKIAPYGPVQWERQTLLAVWQAYLDAWGEPMPVDVYPVHYYLLKDYDLQTSIADFEAWVQWIEQYRGTKWSGPPDYYLTEYGMPAWGPSHGITEDELLACMRDFTKYLATELDLPGINLAGWAWWMGTQYLELVSRYTGEITALGKMYQDLAANRWGY